MNKKLILTLFFPLLVAACSSPKLDEPEVVIDIPTSKSFVGVINKLSVPLNNLDSEYYLLTDSKNRIYLNSLIHNLNDYIDYEVRLRGQISSNDLAGKPIDILSVEQVDIITSPEIKEENLNYESSTFGINFSYLSSFDLEEFASQLSLSDPNSRQLIKLNFIEKNLNSFNDLDSYVESLALSTPKESFVTNNHKFDLFNISSDTIKYFVESNKYILEITYVFLDSSNQYFTDFDAFLSSIVLSDLEIKSAVEELDKEEQEEISNDDKQDTSIESNSADQESTEATEEVAPEDNITDYTQEASTSESLNLDQNDFSSSVDSEYLNTINKFETNVSKYIEDFASSISYSFTDNNEFYLIYFDKTDNQKRVLVDFSSDYKIIASFVEGTVADWDLVSGINIAFDRPLTVLNKQDDQFLPSVSLKEGFRIFESLSMKIQAFYPTNWYFSRQDDVYIFSSDPKTFEPSLLITLLDESASTLYADLDLNQSSQISNNIFVKKLNAGFFKLEFIDSTTDTSYILDSLRDV